MTETATPAFVAEIHCRGCGRLIGVGPSDFKIYCDALCAEDFPAVAQEGRDAVIEAIVQTRPNLTKAQVAEIFGISRQRVDQIMMHRGKTLLGKRSA